MTLILPFREAIVSDWESALARDEWFFSRVEDGIATELSPSEAFAAIDEVATLMQQQTEPLFQWRCGYFLIALAQRFETMEIPSGLRRAWETVLGLLREYPDIVGRLRSWYRQP